MTEDVRWIQRFENYEKALSHLVDAVEQNEIKALTDLEQQGLIKAFEFTFELAWNVMKDYLSEMGFVGIIGSKGAIRQAFNNGLITNGELWMDMIEKRNESSHTYDIDTASTIAYNILNSYIFEFRQLSITMKKYLEEN